MPSFDIVSKVDKQELLNAVDQANREVSTRFDFKDAEASFTLKENQVTMIAKVEFQLKQMLDILKSKLIKRGIDIRVLNIHPLETTLHQCKQLIDVKQGIDHDAAKPIIAMIKESGLKVQPSIQQDQIRLTGKKRDDLQAVIQLLRKNETKIPLQFENFRD